MPVFTGDYLVRNQPTAIRRALYGAAAAGLVLLPAGAGAAAPGQAKKLSPTEVMHDTSQPLSALVASVPARDYSAYADADGMVSFSNRLSALSKRIFPRRHPAK